MVSTGGGIIMDERNRAVMEANGVVVLLEARPETILRRLAEQQVQEDDVAARPMLDADDLEERIHSLKVLRQFNYTLAHWTVHTDLLTPEDAAAEVVRGFEMVNARLQGQTASHGSPDLAATVRTSSGDYPLWVGWDIIEELGERVLSMMEPSAAYIISDNHVQSQARRAQMAMEVREYPHTSSSFRPANRASRWKRPSTSITGSLP